MGINLRGGLLLRGNIYFVFVLCVQIWLAAFLNAVRDRGHHDNIDNIYLICDFVYAFIER